MPGAEFSPASLSAFRDLFDGRRDAHGRGAGECVREEVTDQVLLEHLHGHQRLGVYCVAGPDRNLARWGCVDVNVADWDVAAAIAGHLQTYGIAPHIEKTRARGWHVWVFFVSWVPAWKVRTVLSCVVREIGERATGSIRVFPKQNKTPAGEYGSYVNLPMFGADVVDGRTCIYEPLDGAARKVENWSPVGVKGNREYDLDEVIEHRGLDREPDAVDDDYYVDHYEALVALVDAMRGAGKDVDAQRAEVKRVLIAGEPMGETVDRARADVAGDLKALELLVEKIIAASQSVYWKRISAVSAALVAAPTSDGGDASSAKADPNVVRSTMMDRHRGEYFFVRGDLEYVVTQLDNRRGAMTGTVVITRKKELAARDRVNLDSEHSRKIIEKKVFEQTRIAGAGMDLMNISHAISTFLDELVRTEREKTERSKQGYVLTSKEHDDAERWAKSHPHVLYDYVEFTSHHGLMLEKMNRCVLILMGTSRKLPTPICGIGKGDSASGKSYLASTIFKLFPEEDVREYTRITAAALEYGGEFALQRKIFFMREAPGAEEAQYALRTFMSDGDIIIATVQKDETGRNKTEERRIRGPICFYTTTTQVEINPENETRLLQVLADESAKMTAASHYVRAWSKQHGSVEAKPEDLKPWHNFQRLLRPDIDEIVIPYAMRLMEKFPTENLRARRDFARFLELVCACAYLHQFHRRQDTIVGADNQPKNVIYASVTDYAIVKKLVENSMMRSARDVKAGQEDLIKLALSITETALEDDARGGLTAKHPPGVTVEGTDAEKKVVWMTTSCLKTSLGKAQASVTKLVKALEDGGLVVIDAKHKPLRVRLADAFVAAEDAALKLPTVPPEELFQEHPGDRAHLYDPTTAPDFDDLHKAP